MRIFLPFLAQTWQHALWTPCHGPEVAGRKQPAWGRETGTYKVTEQISICTKDNGANISLLKTRLKNIEKGQLERNLECWTGNGLSAWTFEYQFSSVAQPCPTLCEPMDCSTPGLPVHHQLPEFTQTHVHWVSDAIQPSHPLLSPSPDFSLSQHQGLFKLVNSSFKYIYIVRWRKRFKCVYKYVYVYSNAYIYVFPSSVCLKCDDTPAEMSILSTEILVSDTTSIKRNQDS